MVSSLLRVASSVGVGTSFVPFIGSANIWVEDSLVGQSSTQLTQSLIEKALTGTAPGQLEVLVFDEGLSGLASPFWPLNSGGEKILRILNDEQEFKASLSYLRDHVQAVKNVMQGLSPDLVDFRRTVDYPVEGYKLVVVSADFSMLGEEVQADLSILLKAGPAAGVSFLLHSMTLGVNEFVLGMCNHLTLKGRVVEQSDGNSIYGWDPTDARELIMASQRIANSLVSAKMDPLPFSDVQVFSSTWGQSSANGVTFALGKYGIETVEITLGDELNQRHNMLVTGAVGQGKSNLISIIIHSLCQRYSPDEIQLYLLDFKEGVTLQPFVNSSAGEYLPHARVIGLEADREFGLSVLRDLFDTYKTRMKEFKAAGVQNLRQYREVRPNETMPRIVIIIDEFQMMFADRDRVSDEIAELLIRGVRLFRASGIHVILASQTVGGNMALMGSSGEGLYGQIPVRVALKNSLVGSHETLGDKNDAAAHLRAREAIVNLDYGELSANRKTSIAFADESVLSELRSAWWNYASQRTPPYVFNGERKRSLTDDAHVLAQISKSVSNPVQVFLGSRIEVEGRPLHLPFGRDIGRNIALLGAGDALAEIVNIVLSLATQRPSTRFVVLDCSDGASGWVDLYPRLSSVLNSLGNSIEALGKANVETFVVDLANELPVRESPDDLVILGLGLDRVRTMPMEFQELVRTGPTVGVHVIGWWLKMDSFKEQVGYGGESFFDIRLALRLDPQSAKDLVNDPLLEWRPSENRMLAWDTSEMVEPTRVIPYSLVDVDMSRVDEP